MKVLHVIPSISPTYGGPSRAIVDIERALASRGVDVTTVTTDDDGNGGRDLCASYGQPIATEYATRLYFPRTSEFYTVSTGLRRWLRENVRKYDLVHTHALFSFAPITAAYYARKFGVPYVLRPLGVLAQYGMTHRRPQLKRVSLELVERRLIESASAIHFTSVAEKEEAEFLGLKFRSAVIPLGIQMDLPAGERAETFRCAPKSLNILFLSRLDPKKNIEGLLHALALVAPKYPQLVLNIAGTGEAAYVERLRALVDRLDLRDRVNWLGFVGGQRKLDVFRGATAFVLPSFSENFGIAAAEALAEGVPCIISRGVAISHEIEAAGAGILVDTSPESIAAAIENVIANIDGLSAMRTSGRRLILDEFSLDAMGDHLLALYRDILKPRQCRQNSLLDEITPMILTFNEDPNIERTLAKLAWAKRILIIDSGSNDRTIEIVGRYPQAVVMYRKFDSAAQQCNYGLRHIDSEWVLSMDADYVLSDELIEEMRILQPENDIRGFAARFVYKIYGKALRGSLYPDRVVLYRRADAVYRDEGHTQRVKINGRVSNLKNAIYHDDHKSLDRWFGSQIKYANLESELLLSLPRSQLDGMDRLRLMIVPAPFVAFWYALIWKGCLIDGWAGWYYALQRLCAEIMLSVKLLDVLVLRRLR